MRNGIYTILNGYHLQINTIRDNDEEVLIRFDGADCPFPDFLKSKHEDNVYFFKSRISEIDKAYSVRTIGIHKGYKFEVFDKNTSIGGGDVVAIGTKDKEAIERLTLFGDENWGFTDINKSELEKIWEERTPVFSLPLPYGVNEIKETEI